MFKFQIPFNKKIKTHLKYWFFPKEWYMIMAQAMVTYSIHIMQNILHQSCPCSVNSQMNILKFNYLSLHVVPIECCLKITI
jgi:hypothetical protein